MVDKKPWSWRLNKALFPFFGPAQLGAGPEGERPDPTTPRLCPLCGTPLDGGPDDHHRIERSADGHTATRLHCPAA